VVEELARECRWREVDAQDDAESQPGAADGDETRLSVGRYPRWYQACAMTSRGLARRTVAMGMH
jgi:hypothetical protein